MKNHWLGLLLALPAAPAAASEVALSLPTGREIFVLDGAKQQYLSKSCHAGKKAPDCQAARAVGYTHFNPRNAVDGSLDWGRNPGSYACEIIAHGDPLNAVLPDGKELCVCGFGDGSKVSCGALIDFSDRGPVKDRYQLLPVPLKNRGP